MRSLMIAVLLPAILSAAEPGPVAALAGGGAPRPAPTASTECQQERASVPLVGTVDTVGGTTYDWWFNGPVLRRAANSPDYGLHVSWMYSQELASTTFPDRQVRYNFYDYAVGAWNWIDPDYMQSGANIWVDRSGLGSLDDDPTTGCALVCRSSTHTGAIHIDLARDCAPGAGIFTDECGSPLTDGCFGPALAADGQGAVHVMCTDSAGEPAYVRPWDTLIGFAGTGCLPTGLAASRVSRSLVIAARESGWGAEGCLFRSDDGGLTWAAPETLRPPDAFGGDTGELFFTDGPVPYFDQLGRLHVLATVLPVVNDTEYILPAELWHWRAENSPSWSRIHRAECSPAQLAASVGYNAAYACRPSIGEDADQTLYVTWEQFDSANVEPRTSRLRADIFASGSGDGGLTWGTALKLTDAGTHSNRFPCVSSWVDSNHNTVDVLYLNDQTAGFWVQNEHPGEYNPVLVQHVPTNYGLTESRSVAAMRVRPVVAPSVVRTGAAVGYSVPTDGQMTLVLRDASGRLVKTLARGRRDAGRYSERFSAAGLPAGVYFCTLASSGGTFSTRFTVCR